VICSQHVDTQIKCHPDLSVSIGDVESARQLVTKLKDDKAFYEECSKYAKANYKMQYSLEVWKQKMNFILNTI
jgi:hypothetical protein